MSIHFNGSEETIAVADLCKEFSKDSEVAEKLAANEDLESMEPPTGLPIADPHTNAECRETCCEVMSRNSQNFFNNRNCPNCALTPV